MEVVIGVLLDMMLLAIGGAAVWLYLHTRTRRAYRRDRNLSLAVLRARRKYNGK